MPVANCSIFGCGTNRRHSGVGIFRIPAGKDEKSKEIHDAWIKVITRVMYARGILRKKKSNVVSIKL